jgi:hypothetical protein
MGGRGNILGWDEEVNKAKREKFMAGPSTWLEVSPRFLYF